MGRPNKIQLFVDSANIKEIERLNEYFPIDGVTTNPSIIVKEQKPLLPLLLDIRSVIGDEKTLFVQTIAEKAEDILAEAHYICENVPGNIAVKIPVTIEGIKAIKLLKNTDIKTLATTVYTAMNAYIAAKAGADYVAPYVNRIDNLSGDGVNVVSEIAQIFSHYNNLSCEIIAASFKNVQQIKNVCLAGSDTVTVAPKLIEEFILTPSIEGNVQQFRNDWMEVYGKKSVLLIATK